METKVPKLGEIWEDAEGTLYTIANPDPDTDEVRAFAFGYEYAIYIDSNPLVVLPMRRIFLNNGELDSALLEDGTYATLRYPNGVNVRETP